MKIPKSFTIMGNKVTIREVEKTEENQFGYWDDVKQEIVIAHKVKTNGEYVTLSQEQLESTFLHEVIHSMQWFSGREYDESEAQTYSFMLLEVIKSSGIKINPNAVQEVPNKYDE